MRSRYPKPEALLDMPIGGHVVIEASAGTGKTYLLEHLVVDLLLRGLAIEEILVVTFTEKATWELRRRVRELIERVRTCAEPAEDADGSSWIIADAERELLERALFAYDRAPIQTIHSFCQTILDGMAFDTGMRFGLTLVDGKQAFHRAYRDEMREHLAGREEIRALLESEDTGKIDLERLLYDAYTRGYLDARPEAPAALSHEARLVEAILPPVARRLRRDKRERGLLDFDDMLLWAREAVRGGGSESILATLRERYRCALIDEFQDTDQRQWDIFRRVFAESPDGNRLFIVGDPKQAIYGFREADVQTYRKACKLLAPNADDRLHLRDNRRSTPDLIEATNLILEQDVAKPFFSGETTYDHPVLCGSPDLLLVSEAGDSVAPITVLPYAPPAGRGNAEDAKQRIGRRIARILREGLIEEGTRLRRFRDGAGSLIPAGEVFILTRTGGEGLEIARYLREAGVPYAFYKQEGLFQTFEARDVLSVLRAVAEPGVPAYQFMAWASPFFGLPWQDVRRCANLPETDPLKDLLVRWHALAERGALASLFDRLLHESGLIERLSFSSDSERELTNYLHIFEVLLEESVRRKMRLDDLIELLQDYVLGNENPIGPDGNVQRLESERAAVKILTVHLSKGLEADIVILYGGLFARSDEKIFAYHEGEERRLWVGSKKGSPFERLINEEVNEEARRLLYVGMTRARYKLYLPFIPKGSTIALSGYYKHLNARLASLLSDRETDPAIQRLIEIDDPAGSSAALPGEDARVAAEIRAWSPPEKLPLARRDHADLASLRLRYAPLVTESYTSLTRRDASTRSFPDGGEHSVSGVDAPAVEDLPGDLPGGLRTGRFLHEVIERLPFDTLGGPIDFDGWKALPPVKRLFEAGLSRHGLPYASLDRSQRIVYDALRCRIELGEGRIVDGLHACRNARELEFLYPIPEAAQPLLGDGGEGAWMVGRGYLTGYIDLVFEQAGLTYFADWKSDRLPSYAPGSIADHVAEHYSQQARIYVIGIVRLLGVRTAEEYARRFGGLLYLFLRGMGGEAGGGVYFHRPAWEEIVAHERALRNLELRPEDT